MSVAVQNSCSELWQMEYFNQEICKIENHQFDK